MVHTLVHTLGHIYIYTLVPGIAHPMTDRIYEIDHLQIIPTVHDIYLSEQMMSC